MTNVKPKSLLFQVPGFGMVKREEFTNEHMLACVAHAEKIEESEEGEAVGFTVELFLENNFEREQVSLLEEVMGIDETSVEHKDEDAAEVETEAEETEEVKPKKRKK